MIRWFSLFLFLLYTSCSPKTDVKVDYIVKYGSQEVYSADFINKMMILGFVNYGEDFYSKIYDKNFFEKVRAETLEYYLNTFFMRSLSQKYKLKITGAELQEWIKNRAPSYNKEDLILTLKTNNLSYKDWTGLFRDQLVQHKVSEKIKEEASQKKTKTKEKEPNKKIKASKSALSIAVLSFESLLDAQNTYKKISHKKEAFNKALNKHQKSNKYSWLEPDEIPFYKNIKQLRVGRVSKPFETPWGVLIVRIDQKGRKKENKPNTEENHAQLDLNQLVEAFKKDSKLQINTDLLYSLKIKK